MKNRSPIILLINGHDCPRLDIRQALEARYIVEDVDIADIRRLVSTETSAVVADVPLNDQDDSLRALQALSHLPDQNIGRAFVIDDFTRTSVVRAHAFGGEVVIARPLKPEIFYPSIDLLLTKARSRRWALDFRATSHGLEAGTDAIERVFQLASTGSRLTQHELYDRGDAVIHSIADSGLGRWVEAVKSHHSQTFRHCLLVTGIAVGFGQHLGMRQEDLRRLSIGGLLHDIGKAAIPIEILEKPGALSESETVSMREHAAHGRTILEARGGFNPEMIDVVAHHHEMLDGSGYPDGLVAREIADLVRIMTISDIFSALVEQRSYKPQMSNEEAYNVLVSMEDKLDKALVRAFEPIARNTRLAA